MSKEREIFDLINAKKTRRASELLDSEKRRMPRTKRLFLEGLIMEEEGDLTGALEKYDMALVLHLSDPCIWFSKARGLEALGSMEMAERTIDRAVKLAPDEGSYRYMKAKILFNMNRYREARDEIEEALGLGERSSEAMTLNGILVSIIEQDFKRALSYFDGAIERDPRNSRAWTNRGIALRQIGDAEGAAYSFQKGLLYNPKDKNARENLEKMGEVGAIRAVDEKLKKRRKKERSKGKKRSVGRKRRKRAPGERNGKQDEELMELECPRCGSVFELPDEPGTRFKCPECGIKGRIK